MSIITAIRRFFIKDKEVKEPTITVTSNNLSNPEDVLPQWKLDSMERERINNLNYQAYKNSRLNGGRIGNYFGNGNQDFPKFGSNIIATNYADEERRRKEEESDSYNSFYNSLNTSSILDDWSNNTERDTNIDFGGGDFGGSGAGSSYDDFSSSSSNSSSNDD